MVYLPTFPGDMGEIWMITYLRRIGFKSTYLGGDGLSTYLEGDGLSLVVICWVVAIDLSRRR